MTVFSYTAPHVSEEEERREWDSLSDETKQQIHDELHGTESNNDDSEGNDITSINCNEDNHDKQSGEGKQQTQKQEHEKADTIKYLNEFQSAIIAMPQQNKRDYLHAIETVPDVVERETHPIKFLYGTKNNATLAAFKMVKYWKMRRTLFGSKKAFISMTMRGGAIEDDLKVWRDDKKLVTILPCDQNGRRVFFFDRIRAVPPNAPRDVVLRLIFYMLHVLSDDVSVQRNGYVWVQNIMKYDLYKHFDRILTRQISNIIVDCMPIKIKGFHLVAGNANGVLSLILPVFKHSITRELRLRLIVHGGTTGHAVKESLNEFGLIPKNLTCVIGGDLSTDYFNTWYTNQLLTEGNNNSNCTATTTTTNSINNNDSSGSSSNNNHHHKNNKNSSGSSNDNKNEEDDGSNKYKRKRGITMIYNE